MQLTEGNFEKAVFRSRPNRFTVECLLRGKSVKAYLPNPGRLWELLLPEIPLYLQRNISKDKLPYTVIATEKDGIPVLLHTHLTNAFIEGLIREKKIPGFENMEIIKREVIIGKSRYDFIIRREKREIVLEVKTCTLFGDTLSMFPDAVTERGSRHLLELSRLADKGIDGGVLFVVQWPLAKYFMPDYHTDLAFSMNLLKVRDKLLIKAIALGLNRDLSIDFVKELIIPWELIEREAKDRGAYIIILYLKGNLSIDIGGLGKVSFKKGYYLYVGSAKKELTKRIERHRRKRKRPFWHIDYLRDFASFYKAIPIRTNADLECEIAKGLKRVVEWSIPKFGSSDCTCESHLFGMKEDPIMSPDFIKILKYFRIGRIEEELDHELSTSGSKHLHEIFYIHNPYRLEFP